MTAEISNDAKRGAIAVQVECSELRCKEILTTWEESFYDGMCADCFLGIY